MSWQFQVIKPDLIGQICQIRIYGGEYRFGPTIY